GEERQENVAHFGRDSGFFEDFECLRQIQHFRDRRRLFQAPTAQCLRQTSHAAVKVGALVGSPLLENLGLTLGGRVINSKIKTSPADGVAESPLFVRSQNNKRNTLGKDSTKLGNTELPNA